MLIVCFLVYLILYTAAESTHPLNKISKSKSWHKNRRKIGDHCLSLFKAIKPAIIDVFNRLEAMQTTKEHNADIS